MQTCCHGRTKVISGIGSIVVATNRTVYTVLLTLSDMMWQLDFTPNRIPAVSRMRSCVVRDPGILG